MTSEQLVRHFKASHSVMPRRSIASIDTPAPERFGPPRAGAIDKPLVSLAYATPSRSTSGSAVFSALLTVPLEDDLAASQDPSSEDEAAALPDYEDTPSSGPLPQFRPGGDQAQKPAAETERPETRRVQDDTAPKAERETPKQQELAFVRPNNPADNRSGGGLGALRNLFGGGTRAGNGVAVYDITAAKVYMPDGSVLEAHSGIGKMADNPRYVNVKMTGPTPPHTYNLKMREARFHGVEAIRMLPVDGKNKHGRDGFLTHSYLLRSGRAESHGCVAFKDYKRFLTAFKEGKVRQIVVVPSGGRAAGMYMASNGKKG
ncbi:tlde1 domain-containing protein [Ensifer canadensis]